MFSFFKKLFASPEPLDLKKFKAEGATFLDVRTPAEFKAGHVKGAPNIPVQSLAQNIERVKKMKGPIIIYCRSGGRAGRAMTMLKQHGIECYNAGGLDQVQYALKS